MLHVFFTSFLKEKKFNFITVCHGICQNWFPWNRDSILFYKKSDYYSRSIFLSETCWNMFPWRVTTRLTVSVCQSVLTDTQRVQNHKMKIRLTFQTDRRRNLVSTDFKLHFTVLNLVSLSLSLSLYPISLSLFHLSFSQSDFIFMSLPLSFFLSFSHYHVLFLLIFIFYCSFSFSLFPSVIFWLCLLLFTLYLSSSLFLSSSLSLSFPFIPLSLSLS